LPWQNQKVAVDLVLVLIMATKTENLGLVLMMTTTIENLGLVLTMKMKMIEDPDQSPEDQASLPDVLTR
jgi:hypothetical protein